jgi:DNA polymerase V
MMEYHDIAQRPPLCPIPVFQQRVGAGFPSPAADYAEGRLDFNRLLVQRPAATFAVRITGTSMVGAGIVDGGMVVVDRSVKPVPGKVIVAIVDGSLVVKRLRRERDGSLFLDSHPASGQEELHPPIRIGDGMQFEVWGCVTSAITFMA